MIETLTRKVFRSRKRFARSGMREAEYDRWRRRIQRPWADARSAVVRCAEAREEDAPRPSARPRKPPL